MYNDKWVFFDLPDKKAISSGEVDYWLNNLNKIMKIGLEFEFNLPTAKGFCKGKSKSCPCSKMNEENDCWKKCINEQSCRNTLGEEKFKEVCSLYLCSNFKAQCITCEHFEVNCLDCKYKYNPNNDPDGIRNYLRKELAPSHSYGNINSSGVHSVVCDGSLLGKGSEGRGAEVITVGRRIDYWAFFNMIEDIINKSVDKGAYVNERCSTHVHMLASYYDILEGRNTKPVSELEKPLPQVVLANFHQLCRRYQNAITWMSMGLDTKENLTRWEKYRVSILESSPATSSMQGVINDLEVSSNKSRGKYAWVNYMFCKFDNNNDVTRLHIEMRAMDGLLSTSAVTALSCLYYSLVIKAVEISKYGLLEVGSKNWMDQTRTIKNKLMNNTSGWQEGNRFSDTSCLNEKDMQILRVESVDLINQVKHILFKLGPAYEVLEKLAETPAAIHRVDGKSWEKIEEILNVYRPEETLLDQKIFEIIDFRTFDKCENEKDWLIKVSTFLEKKGVAEHNQIIKAVDLFKKNGICIWSENLGTLLKV